LSTYRLSASYERSPLRRRLSGLALALVINVGLLFVLMGLGVMPPLGTKPSRGVIIDLLPESRSATAAETQKSEARQPDKSAARPLPKPPPIVLPMKPNIAAPPAPTQKAQPWVEVSSADMAAADISKLPSAGSGSSGDSEQVGHGPNGEVLYAAEWAREPTSAELGGYLPSNAPDGYGLIACKTVPGNRVDNCVALGQSPLGSHLASAVLNAAWQFRVKPPRKGGRPLIGSWVQIQIDYTGKPGPGG